MAQTINTFELATIPIEAEFRNVKTLRLTVYPPDGRVRITAPIGTAPEAVKRFAASKIEWIKKHREKFLNQPLPPGPRITVPMRNHSTVYVWGIPYKLELIERSGNPKIVLDGNYLKMYSRPLSSIAKKREYLDRWYRRILKEAAMPVIKKWEAIIRVEVKKLYVRKMKTRWGSCNYRRQTLRLNSELAKRETECLEYVIVHEMLHIIERGHNRKFYRLLNQYVPEWKSIRAKL